MVVAQYGQQVEAWQVGVTGNYNAMWSTQLSKAQQAAQEWLGKLLVRSNVLLGWNAMFGYDLLVPSGLALVVPPSFTPEEIPGQLAGFADKIDHVHLVAQDAQVDRLERLADMALRYAYTRAGGVDSVYIDPPWHVNARGQPEPSEMFLVARTMACWLGGAATWG